MTVTIRRTPIFSPTYGLGEPWAPIPDAASKYDAATTWLKGSSAASALISFLESDKLNIHLLMSTVASMPNKFWIPDEVALLKHNGISTFGENDVMVTWNPTTTWSVHQLAKHRPVGRFSDKGKTKIGQHVRTEIILIHEFGHARQWLLKHDWYYAKWQLAMAGNNQANLDIEHDNLRTVESVVAKQLGQGVRWHYANNC